MMMSGSNPTPSLLLLLLISYSPNSFCSTDHKTAIISCPEIEKQALLSFKESITRDPLDKLSSWNTSSNCCSWKGVSCSTSTGRVDGLDLYKSGLQGRINPSLLNLTSLATLDLSENELTWEIPKGIADLCKMEKLHLYYNNLGGEISDSFGNMSDCFLGSLISLDLSGNRISGRLTRQFGEFRRLQQLHLFANRISGEIPANLGNLSYLEFLHLDDNKFTGNLPMSMGRLSNLRTLRIGNNMLEGVVTEIHFANCSKLKVFAASGNRLTLNVSPEWIPPFNLSNLRLGSWKMGAGLPLIPSWLITQKNTLDELDLSSTGISGNVPAWFWEVRFLNLSHNHLYGKIPADLGSSRSRPRSVYLNSNRFSGSLPRVGYTMVEINLSNNSFSGGMSHFICDIIANQTNTLQILHLGGNHLTGGIPDCWMKWPLLRVLNLGNNNFSGTIPNSLGFLTHLWSLNLYGNSLSGEIPVSVSNCSGLVKMDLSSNYLVGKIPTWIGASLPKLSILILRSNKLSGVIPSTICHLNSLQILDISDNVISNTIPSCVNNFTAMATKRNLSDNIALLEAKNCNSFATNGNLTLHNGEEFGFSSYAFGTLLESASIVTKGNKYEYGGTLTLVTNIDLSNNNLSGEIPKELTNLVELRSLNLSGNNLSRSIPESIGDMKQIESLDFSRNSLSGEIPNSFTAMPFLSYLNLSYNHLTGKMPKSTQLTGMDASSFVENNLCGPPLPINCIYDDDDDGVHGPFRKEDNDTEIDWLYVFMFLGYVVGFSIFCTSLVLKMSWRESYFGFVEYVWNKFYVYFHIKWVKITRVLL